MNRRSLLKSALALGVFTALPFPSFAAKLSGWPFRLGVASGWPSRTGFTIWTRLSISPDQPDGGIGGSPVKVKFEVATDESFGNVVRKGAVLAVPESGYAVHVDIGGMMSGRWFWYRFHVGSETSPVGRVRTCETSSDAIDKLRFGFASCQQFEQGFYAAHRHLADENLDVMLFLGDYIYESSWGKNLVRSYSTPEPMTLDDYRLRWAQHKSDEDLQRLHAVVPWVQIYDDHEIENDWAADQSQDLDPNFTTRRNAALRAFFENTPVPARIRESADPKVYDAFFYGDLVRFVTLDDRLYRSHQACPDPGEGGSNVVAASACPDLDSPDRTMLGSAQEAWLESAITGTERFTVIAQQTLVSPAATGEGPDRQIWTDGWDGYPLARKRLAERLAKIQGALIVGGDMHCTVAADLHVDPENPESPIAAAELCGTSITSEGWDTTEIAKHAHVKWASGEKRGYSVVEIGRDVATLTVRSVNEKDPKSAVATEKTFTVERARPGLQD